MPAAFLLRLPLRQFTAITLSLGSTCVGYYLLVCVCRYALEVLVLRLAREDGAEHSKYAHDFYCFHYYNMWLILNKIMSS